jgi:hypothetical protein
MKKRGVWGAKLSERLCRRLKRAPAKRKEARSAGERKGLGRPPLGSHSLLRLSRVLWLDINADVAAA